MGILTDFQNFLKKFYFSHFRKQEHLRAFARFCELSNSKSFLRQKVSKKVLTSEEVCVIIYELVKRLSGEPGKN